MASWATGPASAGSGWRPARISPRGAAAMRSASSSASASSGLAAGDATAVSGLSPRPSSASGDVAVTSPSTGTGAERVTPGKVEVHGPRPGLAARRGVGAAGDRAEVQEPGVVGLVGSDVAEPARRGAVEVELVDRLPGADPA